MIFAIQCTGYKYILTFILLLVFEQINAKFIENMEIMLKSLVFFWTRQLEMTILSCTVFSCGNLSLDQVVLVLVCFDLAGITSNSFGFSVLIYNELHPFVSQALAST